MWKALMFLLVLPAVIHSGTSAAQHARVQVLEGKLLAPCCYQETVGRHQSEVAVKMRVEIARMVAEGKSDAEILDRYTQQYGARVIADFAPTPGWAHLVPWVLVLLGAAGLMWWLPRMVRRPVETGR
jgi:cytochrome c-type biogenesis protein CcmH